jgi:exonuclease III
MKIMSVNIRVLRGQAKKLTLKWFMDFSRPYVVFIQETMGPVVPEFILKAPKYNVKASRIKRVFNMKIKSILLRK